MRTTDLFSGHEEYVTGHEYDTIQRYRDLGGNLAFLSANDFFYKVVKHGDLMDGRWRWRDLGRPEAALVGAQYVDWNHDVSEPAVHRRPASAAPWLFRHQASQTATRSASTGSRSTRARRVLRPGPAFSRHSRNLRCRRERGDDVLLDAGGREVFSAGVMNFGGSALWPQVRTMIGNLIAYLQQP